MNPLNPRDIQRLRSAAHHSRRQLEPFRRNRLEAIQEYVGKHYSDSGAKDRVPVNLLELAVNIYTQQLSASAPAALVTTRYRELRSFAPVFEAAIMQDIEESGLGFTASQMVMAAIFGLGIVKAGLGAGGVVDIDGVERDAGRIYCDLVYLDDWVHDVTSKSWHAAQFCGNRWTMRLDEAKDHKQFHKGARDRLVSNDRLNVDQETGETKAGSVSRGDAGYGADEAELHKRVELWDYFLPRENLVVTLAEGLDEPLRVMDWDGPTIRGDSLVIGPYHLLGFSDVPDSMMPLPSVALMRDLHDLANRLFRKLGRQAERQKTVYGVRPGGEEDGQRTVEASDGEMIKMLDPNNVKEISYRGIEPATVAFLIQIKDLYAYLNGNLDALGGLSPQSRTLGQDELLTSAASQRIGKMQTRTINCMKGIIEAFARYRWTDPVREMMLQNRVANTDIDVSFRWTPETKRGEFFQYNFDVLPYSMQHQTPGSKLQAIAQYFERFIFPGIPLMQAQGLTINFDALTKTVSRLGNLPELEDLIQPGGMMQPPAEAGAQGDAMPKAAVTTRRYERTNRPGATRQGNDAVLMRALLGNANSQESETAAVGRSYS